jgi:hypothetical protein
LVLVVGMTVAGVADLLTAAGDEDDGDDAGAEQADATNAITTARTARREATCMLRRLT